MDNDGRGACCEEAARELVGSFLRMAELMWAPRRLILVRGSVTPDDDRLATNGDWAVFIVPVSAIKSVQYSMGKASNSFWRCSRIYQAFGEDGSD